MRNNDEATLKNNEFNFFVNTEHIINEKCIERMDYVGITITAENFLEFSDDNNRRAATNIFWYKDKTQSNDSFKLENEFESIFIPVATSGG